MDSVKFTISVGDEQREVEIYVNQYGNLVLSGVGSVIYEMIEEELILGKGE